MLIVTVLVVAALLLWMGPAPAWDRPASRRGRRRRRRSFDAGVDAWSMIIESVATAVRAGAAPSLACAASCRAAVPLAAGEVGEVALLAGAAAAGDDLPAAWRAVADRLADPGLRAVASAWQLSSATGAPLADALDVAARLRRAEVERAARARAALAAPTTSINLLTFLPIAGAGLGVLLGADVLSVYGSGLALVTVLPGILLMAAGRLWCRRMVLRAGRIRSLP